MKIENYRYIKSLQLPTGWTENAPARGIATAIVRSFSPSNDDTVKIELFYRGLPVSEEASKLFRKTLKLAPKLIFDHNNADKSAVADRQLICDLEEVLGNVGNNQIANKDTGYSGPAFWLERLDILVWKGRPLLAVRGWFTNPETGDGLNAFCGFFIDANPNEATCNMEEIYLQAEKEDLYLRYLPQFQECLQTVEWAN